MEDFAMTVLPLLGVIAARLAFGFWAMRVAVKKGRSGNWFFFGFFCGLVGVIVAHVVPDVSPSSLIDRERAAEAETAMLANGGWRCKHCNHVNNKQDRNCRYCDVGRFD